MLRDDSRHDDGPIVVGRRRRRDPDPIVDNRDNRWFAAEWRRPRLPTAGMSSTAGAFKRAAVAGRSGWWWVSDRVDAYVPFDRAAVARHTALVGGGLAAAALTFVSGVTIAKGIYPGVPLTPRDPVLAAAGASAARVDAAAERSTSGSGAKSPKWSPGAVPASHISLYRAAAGRSCGMPWEILAAVGHVESSHGQSNLPGVKSGANYAGARGPMQFMPGTWAAYGVDGDGDGKKDVYNPVDAVHSAANYLCANGAANPGMLNSALWHYNHSSSYVSSVRTLARQYRSAAYVPPVVDGAAPMAAITKPHHDYPAIDVPLPVGTDVVAVREGKVVMVTDDGRCGRGVILDGTDGARYTYCHASQVVVRRGDSVGPGDLIMRSGGARGAPGSGDSTGPHLHLQIENGGRLVCPQNLVVEWTRGNFVGPENAPATGCSY